MGAQAGSVLLNEQGGKSTVLTRTPLTAGRIETTYEIELDVLDNVLDAYPHGGIGLKIDTEGYEMEVMKGVTRHLSRIEFVLAEVSVKNRFENSYSFAEFVSFMDTKGLRFYNIANPSSPKAPNYFDCVFLRRDDPMFD